MLHHSYKTIHVFHQQKKKKKEGDEKKKQKKEYVIRKKRLLYSFSIIHALSQRRKNRLGNRNKNNFNFSVTGDFAEQNILERALSDVLVIYARSVQKSSYFDDKQQPVPIKTYSLFKIVHD